jgi:hypothetical protein
MIYGGLLVFGMMCLWIVYKRIIRGPLGLVLWAAGKAVGSRKTASSVVGKGVLSSTTPAKVEVTTTASVETSYERVEGDDKPLWSEGFDLEDVITEYVTVTVDVDEETAVPEAGRHVEL